MQTLSAPSPLYSDHYDEDFTVDLQAKSLCLLKTLAVYAANDKATFPEPPRTKTMLKALYFQGKLARKASLQKQSFRFSKEKVLWVENIPTNTKHAVLIQSEFLRLPTALFATRMGT